MKLHNTIAQLDYLCTRRPFNQTKVFNSSNQCGYNLSDSDNQTSLNCYSVTVVC